MPAMPMNDAAERYSPEIAEAFQPTDTDRPATKKSLVVFDFFADQKPIAIVTTTVMKENVRIHGSTLPSCASTGKVFIALPSRRALARPHRLRVRWSV